MAFFTSRGSTPNPIESWRWGVVWLMFLATMINYMDRQTLGSTSEFVKKEFGLSEEGYGWVEFWFGISYGLMQFPAGYLSDRLNVRWLYPAALLVWSAAGFATGLVWGPAALMACRVVLGLGEAFNWTCAVGIVRRIIPLDSRSLANGIFHSGASIGAVLTPLLVLAIVGPNGENWRLVFQIVGGLGLLWVALWFVLIHGERAIAIGHPPVDADNPYVQPPPFRGVLTMRQFWITLAVSITVNITWHFYRIWLPRFLTVDLKFSQQDIQWVLAGFFIAADIGSMLAGYCTRRLTYAGYTVETSRKIVMIGTSLLCMLSLPAALAMTPWITLPLVFIVGAAAMGGFANFFALSQEISARHTSFCLGIFGSVAWILIAVMSPPVGALVDRIGTFGPSIMVVGFVPIIGSLVGLWWPEPVKDESGESRVESPSEEAKDHIQSPEARIQRPAESE